MSQEPVSPIPEPSLPPAARIGRAYIDAISDMLQNLSAMAIITWAWNAGKIDGYVALGGLGVVLGFVNAGQLLDRFTSGRAPRAPLTALIGALGASKAATLGGATAEALRRITMLTLLAILPLVVACATFKSINDAAIEFCEATMGAEAALNGVTVEELCRVPQIISPFLRAKEEATAASRRTTGIKE